MERLTAIWPNDLLQFTSLQDLVLTENPLPGWAKDSLSETKTVVVRRGLVSDNLIPVGIRGYERKQRFACYLNVAAIKKQYHPQYFIQHKSWESLSEDRQKLPPFQALQKIVPLLSNFQWGIGGSLGYEMATGVKMVKNTTEHVSDLDLLLYQTPTLNRSQAQELLQKLNQYHVHADVQVVKGQNGFSLEEYAANRSKKTLVKTAAGPLLVVDPWQFLQENK